ncbi:recombination protein o reco [Lucifera butyrica]|uniref:DNA repair protein RecO n=1 Tax=Lucifera butyrica TaxID=1351585 RepID=A0A498R5H5_9FIRM|nr:DNA repair protein RecO [Lucifera butyrica]VBB06077.1 recombination protein o reco [Lucifera butyrica]
MQYQTEAILLSVRDWGDADRMVTLFSGQFGKLHAVAYGAKRPRNRLAGSLQVFSHVDVMLAAGKTYESIRQCEIINSNRALREDLNFMAYASFLAELAAELWPEREPEPRVFALLAAAFSLIHERHPRLVALAGAWQLLVLAGYYAHSRCCRICGKKVSFPANFIARNGGCTCLECSGGKTMLEIGEPAFSLIERFLELDWSSPGSFTVHKSALLQAEMLLLGYLTEVLDRPLKSINFLKHVALLV